MELEIIQQTEKYVVLKYKNYTAKIRICDIYSTLSTDTFSSIDMFCKCLKDPNFKIEIEEGESQETATVCMTYTSIFKTYNFKFFLNNQPDFFNLYPRFSKDPVDQLTLFNHNGFFGVTFNGKTFCLDSEKQHVETLVVNPYTAIHKLLLENITYNNLIINGEIDYFSLVNLVSKCKKNVSLNDIPSKECDIEWFKNATHLSVLNIKNSPMFEKQAQDLAKHGVNVNIITSSQ